MAPVTETTWISARIPVDLRDQLSALAEKADRSTSAELRLAIKFYVEQATKEVA